MTRERDTNRRGAQGGSIVGPVAHHQHRLAAPHQLADDGNLAVGQEITLYLDDTNGRSHRACVRGVIAGQQDDASHAHAGEVAEDISHAWPQCVRVLDDPGDLTIDRNVRAKARSLRLERAKVRFINRCLVEHERPGADDDVVTVDRTRNAPPWRLDDAARGRQRQARGFGSVHESPCQQVSRRSLDGAGHP